jgi:hypothetical protein
MSDRLLSGRARSGRTRAYRPAAFLLLLAALAPGGVAPARAQETAGRDHGLTNSARYRFEGNKWLALDLAVEDVRAETIRFEWPATLLRLKTGYKALVKVVNGSSRQARIGVAVALYDADTRLVGTGAAGTTLGTIDPGDAAQFAVEFSHVTERLEEAATFHIALEVR